MNTPGDIYKNDDGLCFVPDVKLSFDELIELMKLNMTICSSEYIEDDWQYVESINKPSRRKFVHGNYHVEMWDDGLIINLNLGICSNERLPE